jgi:DNA recombination protein RmuC
VLTFAITAVIAAAVGYLVSWLVSSRRTAELSGQIAVLSAENSRLNTAATAHGDLLGLLAPVRESLDGLQRSTAQASERRTEAETAIREQIGAMRDQYASLSSATSQIVASMTKGQTRGQWGEMQLERLLDHAGLVEGVHYRRQDTRAGETVGRPDIAVLLPGGGEVLVDAKFPFDAYWAAAGTDDDLIREQSLTKHARDVMARVNELAGKRYSDSAVSPDFVVMFLPFESLLSSALDSDGLLLEKSFEKRVVIATPTTMLALLRTIGFGYERKLMHDNAEEIRLAGAEMLKRLGVLVEHLADMRAGLQSAVNGYNKFVGSFDRNAMSQARKLNEMGVASTRSLEAPAEIEASLRGDSHQGMLPE